MPNKKTILKYILISFLSIILLSALISFMVFYKNNFMYSTLIHAQFTELGPIYDSMPVYYKGFKIGKTKKIKPSTDYKYSLVKIILYPKKLIMPANIEAKVSKLENDKEYIELVYPEIPSENFLKTGMVIEGKTTPDLESFMSAQIESGMFSAMSDNMNKTLISVESTSDEVNAFFGDLRVILAENRNSIKRSTENTAQTIENLNSISRKLDRSLEQRKLNNITTNIEGSSDDIKATTETILSISKNLDAATKNLDKTMEKVDLTISEAHSSMENITDITTGVNNTMSKRFGGARVIFGKPTAKSKIPKQCSK